MRAYIDEIKQQQFFAGIPQALRAKKAAEIEAAWQREYRLQFEGYGPGFIVVNISGSDREGVFQWLDTAGICAVDIEARDLLTIYGKKDPISLSIVHSLQVDPNVQNYLSRVEPDDIFNRLNQLAIESLKRVGTINPLDEHVMVERMRAAGIDVLDDNSAGLEPPAPYEPSTQWDDEFGLVPAAPDSDLFTVADSMPGIGEY